MKYKKISVTFLFAMMVCPLLGGCGSSSYKLYTGELPKDQVVVVSNAREGGDRVRVLAVDAKRGPNGPSFGYCDPDMGLCSLEMAPGEHTFTLFYVFYDVPMIYCSTHEVFVKVTLQAGHYYIIRADAETSTLAGQFYVWDATEKRVLDCDNTYTFALAKTETQPPPSTNYMYNQYEMQRQMNMSKQIFFPTPPTYRHR
ncbi:MAG: hypothetical protein ABSB25_01355 [Sedimentisphaerales bacterium]